MHLPTTPLKSLGVAAASAGLVLTGGLGAAYAGVLPGAAQDAVQGMLASINVDVPGADEHSEGHADTGGRSEEAPPAGTTEPGTKPEQAEHGETVSGLATSTEGGRDKGELISETASDGKAGGHSQEHAPEQPTATGGADGTDAGAAARSNNGQGDHAKVETPNGGGTTTADGATADAGTTDGGGASGHGTGTAGDMSDGRSRDGSGNRP